MYVTLRGTHSSSDDDPSFERPRRSSRVPRTVLALGAVSLLTDISSESVSAVLPLYLVTVLGMGPLAYGFVDGIYQGATAVVRLLGGWWADSSRRPKWISFVGYAISAASRIGLVLASGFGAVTTSVVADRLGKGLRTGPRDALIVAASDPRNLGRNFGIHRAMDTTGALVGPLLAFAVLAAVPVGLGGFRAVFVFSAAFAMMGLLVMVLAVPDLRGKAAGHESDDLTTPTPVSGSFPSPRTSWQELKQPELRRLLVAAGLLGLVTIGDGFLYLALADRTQLGAQYFPLLFVGTNAVYLALAVPLGHLADRVGRGAIFIGGHAVLLVAYVAAASSWSSWFVVVLVLVSLGTFYAATDGVLSALAGRAVPQHRRASGIAAAQTVVALSRFASAVAFGFMWQLTQRSVAIWVVAAALVLVLPLAALVLRRSVAKVAS